MCIRDSYNTYPDTVDENVWDVIQKDPQFSSFVQVIKEAKTVSYTHLTLPTERSSVDLGGRRLIKQKKNTTNNKSNILHSITSLSNDLETSTSVSH